jgi:hypothetical protein
MVGTIHPNVELSRRDERWARGLLTDFSVSWAREGKANNADITAAILTPEQHMRYMLGLTDAEEVLVVYSRHHTLQRRVFQAAGTIFQELPFHGRVVPHFFILVSPAPNLEEEALLHDRDPAIARSVVPIAESSLVDADAFTVRTHVQKYLFRRDLFDVQTALKSDVFFFGRKQLYTDMIDAARTGENIGLFGLRRTGKTSLLFKVQRGLAEQSLGHLHFVDLQDPELYGKRWWDLIARIVVDLNGGRAGAEITADNATSALQAAVSARLARTQGGSLVLAFDEIEHVVPGRSLAKHWAEDFFPLWKSIRAVQTRQTRFSIVVAGVNASSVEQPTFGLIDNPLLRGIRVRYLAPLDRSEVRDMTRTLGRYMGLQFDEDVYDYLIERYGGHALMTREACSYAWKALDSTTTLPHRFVRAELSDGEEARERRMYALAENVLDLLKNWYRNEWDMLVALANGEETFFREVARGEPSWIEHLVQYGLVGEDPLRLRIPLLASHLRRREENRAPRGSSGAEQETVLDALADHGRLRNRLEPKLRRFIKRQLQAHVGPKWISFVLDAVPSEERKRLEGVDKDEILQTRLLLSHLVTVLDTHWPKYFSVLESGDPAKAVKKHHVRVLLDYVNTNRQDAHAKPLEKAQTAALEIAVTALESAIDAYLAD